MTSDFRLQYLGTASLLVDMFNKLVHSRHCAGEDVRDDEQERMESFVQDFNAAGFTVKITCNSGGKWVMINRASK